jgi:glycosyltransferase involved in cell wall biosynthesis
MLADQLFVVLTPSIGISGWKKHGIYDREMSLFRKAARNDFRIILLSPENNSQLSISTDSQNSDISIIVFPVNRMGLVSYPVFRKVLMALVQFKSVEYKRTFITNQLYGAHIAFLLAKLTNSRFIVRMGYDLLKNQKNLAKISVSDFLKLFLFSLYQIFFLGLANHIVVSDSAIRKTIYKNKTILLPNFVNFSTWDIKKVGICSKRSTLKIYYAGRLEEYKGLGLVIEAIGDLAIEFDVFGEGSDGERLARLTTKFGSRVRFHGHSTPSEILDFIDSKYLFILPSAWEGHPKVACEAMALGIPLLIANESVFDGLVDRENCFTFSRDVQDIKKLLKDCLEGTLDLKYVSQNAYKFAIQNFSIEQYSSRLVRLVRETT